MIDATLQVDLPEIQVFFIGFAQGRILYAWGRPTWKPSILVDDTKISYYKEKIVKTETYPFCVSFKSFV